jgi:hypothetical protein
VLQYLQSQAPMRDLEMVLEKFERRLVETHEHLVTKDDLARLEAVEKAEAVRLGVEDFKFDSNGKMFAAMGF